MTSPTSTKKVLVSFEICSHIGRKGNMVIFVRYNGEGEHFHKSYPLTVSRKIEIKKWLAKTGALLYPTLAFFSESHTTQVYHVRSHSSVYGAK